MPKAAQSSSPFVSGVSCAALAALTFGATAPVVEHAGRGVGPFLTAALLYAGACAMALVLGRVIESGGARLGRAQLRRLGLVALFGGAVAPTLLAFGLQRAGATTGSLLLNLEAVFTVLLARACYREPIGSRVATALAFMSIGGIVLTLDVSRGAQWSTLGALAVAGATLAWAVDNTLTRPLSEFDPLAVVAGKGALGAMLTGCLAAACREPVPEPGAAAVLVACGATGYGLSLRLYLLAQRRIGAARTGSVFALAPFVGAALAWLLGDRTGGVFTWLAATCFGAGVLLHVTERHRHRHFHPRLVHEHAHRHDDGHHFHRHDPPVVGEHTHVHEHEPLEHDHEHAPDLHHDHDHERGQPS